MCNCSELVFNKPLDYFSQTVPLGLCYTCYLFFQGLVQIDTPILVFSCLWDHCLVNVFAANERLQTDIVQDFHCRFQPVN